MNEDAACGNPCGLEPFGCSDCINFTGVSAEELYQHNLAYDEDLDPREYEDDYDR